MTLLTILVIVGIIALVISIVGAIFDTGHRGSIIGAGVAIFLVVVVLTNINWGWTWTWGGDDNSEVAHATATVTAAGPNTMATAEAFATAAAEKSASQQATIEAQQTQIAKPSPTAAPTEPAPTATAAVEPTATMVPTEPAATVVQPTVTPQALACATTDEANMATNSDVQRVGGEACAYTLRVAAIGETGVKCSVGWTCTLTIGDTFVFLGDDSFYQGVTAGTVRYISAYPQGDAVYGTPPCELVRKEHDFGQAQVPPFPVFPGNFDCDGQTASYQASSPSGGGASTGCPTSSSEAAALVGGNVDNWAVMPKTDNTGWKYGPGATPATLTAPSFGRVDYSDNGLIQLREGQSGSNITEATLWCNG